MLLTTQGVKRNMLTIITEWMIFSIFDLLTIHMHIMTLLTTVRVGVSLGQSRRSNYFYFKQLYVTVARLTLILE